MSDRESAGPREDILEHLPDTYPIKKIIISEPPERNADEGARIVDIEYKNKTSYSIIVNGDGRVSQIIEPSLEDRSEKAWSSFKPNDNYYGRKMYDELLVNIHEDILAAELDDELYGVILAMKPLDV